MRSASSCLSLPILAIVAALLTSAFPSNESLAYVNAPLLVQDEPEELSAEEAKSIKIAQRFLSILEKSPRRGTALDRVYGHHVEFGTLDELLKGLRERTEKDPEDGTAWMLLGMFEAHRGQDAEAVDAFTQAEKFRDKDAMPSYYMGQSLLLIGQPEKAVEAFERAIDRKPRRPDMLEIFRQLGRVHQRAQRTEEALEVWDRLEKLFPDDARVQEQIAITMVEEGEYDLALPRYEKLATLVRDDYRKVTFNVEAAELKIRLGKRDEGIDNLEKLLSNLNPTGWLFRDVRRRIEDVFLRSGDQDGLVTYYEKWIEKNPEDIGAIARLARFLASSARIEEATNWMEKALKLAPKRTDLRKSFIDQLVNDQRYAEASKQYAELVKSAPGNPDFLRDWGRLVMKDRGVDKAKRREQAMKIWNRIVEARPNDALTHAQVADLYRQSELEKEAIERYENAIKLAPNEPQYREYLGEYFHILKRSEEALKTWESIADGERKTAENVARLAEVYNSFGYLPQAVEKIAIACELEPKEFTLQLRAAEYHMRQNKFDEALNYNTAAGELSASEEETELALKNRIEIFQTNRNLDEEIDRLRSLAESESNKSAEQWHVLARYLEADRDWARATDALEKALEIDAKSIPVLTTFARIAETSGDFARAAAENRKLAEIDRRLRSEHLMNVARLEAQLGNRDEALAAGRELIVAAPGNTDNYEFFSQLCYRLGETEMALDALRKAVRINPTEPALTMSLGRALAEEFRNDEAIEVYWRAFEKSEEIEDKTTLVQKLTPLYEQQNQFDKLLERLERDRQEESQRREMTICIAQAHNTSGDYGTARRELESLLTDNTKDTNLLQQLSKLCESGSDLAAAVEYQTQLAKIAPGHESEFRLAKLLFSNGQRDAASEIFLKLTAREENPVRLLRSVDGLLRRQDFESVVKITEPLLSESRDDWELLYREGVALAKLEKSDEAKIRFERILALNFPHDKMGVSEAEKFKRAKQKAKSNNQQGVQSKIPDRKSAFELARGQAEAAKQAVGLERQNYYSNNQLPPLWTPSHYGVSRMAAIAWLTRFESDAEVESDVDEEALSAEDPDDVEAEEPPSFADAIVEKGQQEEADIEDVYDWLYVESLKNNYSDIFKISRRLAADGGEPEQRFFLSSLAMRHVDQKSASNGQQQDIGEADPLSDADIDLMLKCFEAISEEDDAFGSAFAAGKVLFSGGRMYVRTANNSWQSVGDGKASMAQVVKELKLAGREELATKMVNEKIDAAKKPTQLVNAMLIMVSEKKFDRVDEFFEKWKSAASEEIDLAPIKVSRRASKNKLSANQTGRVLGLVRKWTGSLAAEEENAKVLSIINDVLDVEMEERVKILKQAKASRRRASRSQTYYNSRIPWQYGDQQSQANVEYPRAGKYISNTGIQMLRQAWEVLKKNEVEEDLLTLVRGRVESAKDSEETVLFEKMLLATVLFWQEEKDDAVEIFREVATQLKDDPSFQFEIASLYEKLGELDESLNIVEAIEPRKQSLVQQKETTVLRLAERLGDLERARTAAERLFGLRLKAQEQLKLVANMKRLGMVDMADAVISRAQRRSGQKIPAMVSLMGLYQGQGKTDLAAQVAHRILQRTRSSVSTQAMVNNTRRYYSSNSNESNRKAAVSTLQQTGALNKVIARLEGQQKRSPDSPAIYEQLIEFYMHTNNTEKLIPMLETAVELRPKSSYFREQLAKQYSTRGMKEEACEQYAAAIRTNPSILSNDYYRVKQFFKAADQMDTLLKILSEINIRDIGQPYYVANFASELLQQTQSANTEEMSDEEKKDHEATEAAAYRLAEKIFNEFPGYRRYVIDNFSGQEVWKNKRLFNLARRSIIPARSQVKADPWYGLNDISSYGSDGEISSMFHDIFESIEGTDQEKELYESIKKNTEKKPDWLAGRVMMAMFDLRDDKEEKAKTDLKAIFEDEEVLKSVRGEAARLVAQELEKFTETRELAIELLENAAKQADNNGNEIRYTSVGKLISIYVDSDQKEKARDLLMDAVKKQTHQNYDQQYQKYQKGQTTQWVATKLMEIEYPAEATTLLQGMLNDESLLNAWKNYGSGNMTGLNALYAKALEATLAKADSVNIAEKMIAIRENPRSGEGAIDLQVGIKGKPDPNREPIHYQSVNGQLVPYYGEESDQPPAVECKLLDLIDTISKRDVGKGLMEQRLEQIVEQHPEDKSVAIASAWFQIQHNEKESAAATKSLLELLHKQPLDEIREGRRPNSRQRREAMQHVALWPLAQKCLLNEDEELKKLGNDLGELAIEGAMRQTDKAYRQQMLFDWGKMSVSNKDMETAEAKWSQLLDNVTARPTRKKKKPATKAMPGMPGRVPMRRAPGTGMNIRGTSPSRATSPWRQMPKVAWEGRAVWTESSLKADKDHCMSSNASGFLADLGLSTAAVWNPRLAVLSDSLLQVPVRARMAPKAVTDEAAQPSVSLIPPLTNSQFQIAHQIALAATDNDMVELSKRAMRELLKGGLPVDDPNFGNSDPRMARTIVYSSSVTQPSKPGDATNAAGYGGTIIKLLDAWEKKEDAYPPAEVYEMIVGELFPENRVDEILLYENSNSISSAKVSSLAQKVIEWAKRADKLDDLQKRTDERATQPRAATSAMVLSGLIALERKDFAAANESLKQLLDKISKQPIPRDIKLACHVAIPAYTADESLRPACIDIYRKKMSTDKSPSLGTMSSRVNRHLAKSGSEAEVRKFFEDYLIGQQNQYANYGGDYGIYQMQRALFRAASDVAQFNLTDLAMEYVGRGKDIKVTDYGENEIQAWEVIARQVRKLPADQRYEKLKEWTLPKPDRQTIRFTAVYDPATEDSLADMMKPEKVGLPESSFPGVHCNWLDLIEAASEAGKIDDLESSIDSLDAKTFPESEIFKVWLAIQTNDPDAKELVTKWFAEESREKRRESTKLDHKTNRWVESLIYRMCIRNPETYRDVCEKHRETVMSGGVGYYTSRNRRQYYGHSDHLSGSGIAIRRDYEKFKANILGAEVKPGTLEPLKHWTSRHFKNSTTGVANPWSVLDDSQLTFLGGNTSQFTWLDYPLTGNFKFSCDVLSLAGGSSDISFGGVLVDSLNRESNFATVQSIGGQDRITHKTKTKPNVSAFNKVTVEVTDGVLKHSLNDKLVYEEKLTGTYPWLSMASSSTTLTAWRNPVFEGTPEIAKEVQLVVGDRLAGWRSDSKESLIAFRQKAQPKPKDKDGKEPETKELKPEEYGWHAKDGVLYGKANEKAKEESDSLLSYRRPLAPGEQFSFEFKHESGEKMANPTIGSIVIGLEDGEKAQELYAGDDELNETSMYVNVVESPHATDVVSFKKDDWNRVDLRLTESDAEVLVNEVLVWRRPLEKLNNLFPGVHKFKTKAAELRNVVLTGDWPESLPESLITNPFESDRTLNDADRSLIADAIGDRMKSVELAAFYSEDAKVDAELSAEQRYETLRDWVLPGNGHKYRFEFKTKAPKVPRTEKELANNDLLEVNCPAWDMIQLATEAGKIDELSSEINALKLPEEIANHEYRHVSAIKALVAIAAEDDKIAREHLNAIFSSFEAEEAKTKKDENRKAALNETDHKAISMAAWFATGRPALLDCATSLQPKCRAEIKEPLLARIEKQSQQKDAATPQQWTPLSSTWPMRERGQWRLLSQGMLDRLPGSNALLVYQSPLRGKFEITADIKKDTWIDYGGYRITPGEKSHRVMASGSSSSVKAKRKVPNQHSVMHYRIAVDDKVLETYVNDIRVSRHEFKHAPRPWLKIQANSESSRPIIQNVRISGGPEVPAEIDCLAADFPAWAGSFSRKKEDDSDDRTLPQGYYQPAQIQSMHYSHHTSDTSNTWTLDEEELVSGSLNEHSPESDFFDESWLYYARPMLEDGEFEFEMFAEEKTKKLCHVSIGRSALLMQKDGVLEHVIVNGSKDFETEDKMVPDSKGVEFKDGQWNHVLLRLKGDDVTLLVNDTEVCSLEIADAKRVRFPGLFRFSDQSNAQIRNVKLRGDWSKTLPPVEEQELALISNDPFEGVVEGEATVYDLSKTADELKAAGLQIQGEDKIEFGSEGLKIAARKNADGASWPSVTAKVDSTADFDVSIDIADVKIANVTGWGCNLDLEVGFNDAEKSAITCGIRRDKDDDLFLLAQREYDKPDGERAYDWIQLFEPFETGTLRMVRRDGKVYCLAGPKGKAQTVIASFTVGNKAVSKFAAIGKSATDTAELDGVVKQMSIKLAE